MGRLEDFGKRDQDFLIRRSAEIDVPNLIRETGDRVGITERAERRIAFLIEKTDGAGDVSVPLT